MSDESRYGPSAGGGADKPGWTSPQPARVSQRPGDDGALDAKDEASVFVIGANASTLAVLNSLRPAKRAASSSGRGTLTAHLIPLAWTPRAIVLGDSRQDVGVPFAGLYDWIDRTFPPDDEHVFVAPLREVELLARIGWEAPYPSPLDDRRVLNVEDLPDDLAEALVHPALPLTQCAACRRLCVRDDFVWREKQLCAWDYHAQVFGKRGPWRDGPYEERHFATLPSCAFVAPELLADLSAEVLMSVGPIADAAAYTLTGALIDSDPERPHLAVRTPEGIVVLRERPATSSVAG